MTPSQVPVHFTLSATPENAILFEDKWRIEPRKDHSIEFKNDGSIYHDGKRITTDKELVEALKRFLNQECGEKK
jgi:hypothetical protein